MIALLALIVLGPEKLPKLAAQLGRWTGRARSMARNLRQQLEQEVSYDDLLKQKQAAEEALRKANAAPMDFHQDIVASINPEPAPAPPIEAKTEPTPEPIPEPAALPATGKPDAATDSAK